MANMTTYLRNKYRDHMGPATAFTAPTGKFVQLHSSDPTVAGTVGAIAGVSRQATTLVANGNGALTNSADVVFASMPAAPTISHYTVWDVVTTGSGNALFQGALVATRSTTAGQTLRIPAGDLDITFT